MKNAFVFMALLSPLVIALASCDKEDIEELQAVPIGSDLISAVHAIEPNQIDSEIDLLEVEGVQAYEMKTLSDLTANTQCSDEITKGIVAYYQGGKELLSLNFGNGACDHKVEVSWIDKNLHSQSKIMQLERVLRRRGERGDRPGEDCFRINFPHTLLMPDGSSLTLNSPEDRSQIRAWYAANEDYRGERPEFDYPIEITLRNGDVKTINNSDELKRAKELCDRRGERGDRPGEDCFRINFPHTLLMPDGSSLTLNSPEDRSQIRAWYAANEDYRGERPEFDYPIEITLMNGDVKTINNSDELKRAKELCDRRRGR